MGNAKLTYTIKRWWADFWDGDNFFVTIVLRPIILWPLLVVGSALSPITASIMLLKRLYNWIKELEERKTEERIVGCKLTKSEMVMLKDAKKRDSHFTDEYVREFGEYKKLAKQIREQTREELYRQGK